MTADLTPAVARALEAAQHLARRRGGDAVEPPDVLHALLLEEEGRAAALLVAAGLDWPRYRAGHPELPRTAPPTEALPVAARLRRSLGLARELAPDLSGEATVASDAPLLALLRGPAVRALLETPAVRPETLRA